MKLAILTTGDPGKSLGGACTRDIINIEKLLIEQGFNSANIFILTENLPVVDNSTTQSIILLPTKENINKVFATIAEKTAQEENSFVFFSYSGHGFNNVGNIQGEFNEAILLEDGLFSENSIYSDFVCKLAPSCTLFALMDACHSEDLLELPFLWDNNTKTWNLVENNRETPAKCRAYSLSGCTDGQCCQQAVGECGFGGSLTVGFLDLGLFHKITEPTEMMTEIIEFLSPLDQVPCLCSLRID